MKHEVVQLKGAAENGKLALEVGDQRGVVGDVAAAVEIAPSSSLHLFRSSMFSLMKSDYRGAERTLSSIILSTRISR